MRWWWSFTLFQLRSLWSRRQWLAIALAYQTLVVAMFPLALGAEHPALVPVAPVILWLGLFLSMLLNLHLLFDEDVQDGLFEQLYLLAPGMEVLVLAKSFFYWLVSGVPLLCMIPVLGLALPLTHEDVRLLLLSLCPASLALSSLAALVAALTAGMQQRGGLAYLLLLPLVTPLLLFGLNVTQQPGSADASLLALWGMAVALVPISTLLSAQSLKQLLS